MKSVRARFGLDQNHCSIATAKLRGEIIGDDLKLLDRRKGHTLAVLVFRVVVVIHPIDLKRGAACSSAVEIDRRAGGRLGVVLSARRILLKTCERLGERQKTSRIKCR